MKAKHTPGPWHLTRTDSSYFIVAAGGLFTICTLKRYTRASNSRLDADARLLRAAPEMLQALRDALNFCLPDDEQGPEHFPPSPVEWAELRATLRAAIQNATME